MGVTEKKVLFENMGSVFDLLEISKATGSQQAWADVEDLHQEEPASIIIDGKDGYPGIKIELGIAPYGVGELPDLFISDDKFEENPARNEKVIPLMSSFSKTEAGHDRNHVVIFDQENSVLYSIDINSETDNLEAAMKRNGEDDFDIHYFVTAIPNVSLDEALAYSKEFTVKLLQSGKGYTTTLDEDFNGGAPRQ